MCVPTPNRRTLFRYENNGESRYISCRSRHGRAWAYAALRFQLDEHALLAALSLPQYSPATSTLAASERGPVAAPEITPIAAVEALSHDPSDKTSAISSNFSRSHRRWLQFQKFHVARCRTFVIPCRASEAELEIVMTRPAFDLKFMRPLQHLADIHPKFYVSIVFFLLAVPNVLCLIFLQDASSAPHRSIANIVLNLLMVIMFLGVLSSRRLGLDRVAAIHVVSSFRFAACSALLAQWVGIYAYNAHTGAISPATATAIALLAVMFLECALLDCAPHLPTSTQILITVISSGRPRNNSYFYYCFAHMFLAARQR